MLLIALLTTLPTSATANSPEEKLAKCDLAYVSCKKLVKAQDEVIGEQAMVITVQQEEIKTLEDRDKWYNSPIFWGVMGTVLGVAGGVMIGVSR